MTSRKIQNSLEIISDKLLGHLPFSTEPLLSWGEDTDLHHFLWELYNQEGTIVTADGHKENINYADVGHDVYQQGRRDFRQWAYRFTQSAEKSAKSLTRRVGTVELPDFYEDPSFGTTAKYIVAWNEVVGGALSSGTFFSISHILESTDDLECSLMLASELYYKHALQVLRSFLEDLVLPVYFGTNPHAHSRWRENSYRTPSLRRDGGILDKLVDDQVLDEELKGEVSDLYGSLNSFVHGSERRLVNKGQYTRTWIGHAFGMDDYLEWCNYTMRAVTLAVHLLRINLAQWETFRAEHKVVCPICHNDDDFSAQEFVFGGEQFTQYHCQICGDEMTHSSEGKQAYGQSLNGQLFSYQY